MNMKKTIAALAAGAVAVSAMATTVSALADTSLTYNLVKKYEVKKNDAHKATYEFTIQALPEGTTEGTEMTVKCSNAGLTVNATEDAPAGVYTYTAATSKWVAPDAAGLPTGVKSVTVPATAPANANATETYTAVAVGTVTDAAGNDVDIIKWFDTKGNDVTANVTEDADANTTVAADSTIDFTAAADKAEGWYDEAGKAMPSSIAVTAGTPAAKDTITVTAATEGEAIEGAGYPEKIEITIPAADKVKSMVVKVASNEAGEQNKIYTYSTDDKALNYNSNLSNKGLVLTEELNGYSGALAITVTVDTETAFDEVGKINAAINAGNIATTNAGATKIVAKAFTKGGEKTTEYFAPFKTEIKNNVNITAYLEGRDVKFDNITAKGQGYHNVGAVLNDAIENYEAVTFTFNTATNGIVWTVDNASENYFDYVYGRNDAWAEDSNGMKKGGTYSEALAKLGQDPWNQENAPASMLAVYSDAWFADSSYKSFDQHLYQGTNKVYGTYTTSYASEATGYTGFDWTGYNLFQGALVINENLTMSLAETDYFDWTATSLSFDWDAIMDGAMTSNDYAVYLHSMKLATSNTWYWDNMVVTLTAGAAEDGVDAEAGVEADDEELAEEEVTEEVVEEEVEEEVEVEVANPTTGNASVALAVIPVALAAAAVVAKKRS